MLILIKNITLKRQEIFSLFHHDNRVIHQHGINTSERQDETHRLTHLDQLSPLLLICYPIRQIPPLLIKPLIDSYGIIQLDVS